MFTIERDPLILSSKCPLYNLTTYVNDIKYYFYEDAATRYCGKCYGWTKNKIDMRVVSEDFDLCSIWEIFWIMRSNPILLEERFIQFESNIYVED